MKAKKDGRKRKGKVTGTEPGHRKQKHLVPVANLEKWMYELIKSRLLEPCHDQSFAERLAASSDPRECERLINGEISRVLDELEAEPPSEAVFEKLRRRGPSARTEDQ